MSAKREKKDRRPSMWPLARKWHPVVWWVLAAWLAALIAAMLPTIVRVVRFHLHY